MILERKTNYPSIKPIEILDYSKYGICCKCEKKYERYSFSGIMLPLCKECRYGT